MTLEECKRLILDRIIQKYEEKWPGKVPKNSMKVSLLFLSGKKGLSPDRERLLNLSLSDLEKRFRFEFDHMNLSMKVYTDDENFNAIYSEAGKTHPEKRQSEFLANLQSIEVHSDELLERIHDTKWCLSHFSSYESDVAIALVKLLDFCLTGNEAMHYRQLSSLLLSDSKAYERMNLSVKLASLLRLFSDREDLSDNELLESYGIFKTPELFEITGDFQIHKEDGSVLDFSSFTHAGVLSAIEIEDALKITTSAKRVLMFENRANYYAALKKRESDEIVVFEAGFFGPGRRKLFELLYVASPSLQFFHSGDIDAGGFEIFIQLRRIMPRIECMNMDVETMNQHLDSAKSLTDSDRKRLGSQLLDPELLNPEIMREKIQFKLIK